MWDDIKNFIKNAVVVLGWILSSILIGALISYLIDGKSLEHAEGFVILVFLFLPVAFVLASFLYEFISDGRYIDLYYDVCDWFKSLPQKLSDIKQSFIRKLQKIWEVSGVIFGLVVVFFLFFGPLILPDSFEKGMKDFLGVVGGAIFIGVLLLIVGGIFYFFYTESTGNVIKRVIRSFCITVIILVVFAGLMHMCYNGSEGIGEPTYKMRPDRL